MPTDEARDADAVPMRKKEFAETRRLLGKSQRELARLLGVSLKAVESYEQGWRSIPSAIERMAYLLLFKSNPGAYAEEKPCWESISCDKKIREKCMAYVSREGNFCWFFTGGLCGTAKGPKEGERCCHGCEVFLRMKSLSEAAASEGLKPGH